HCIRIRAHLPRFFLRKTIRIDEFCSGRLDDLPVRLDRRIIMLDKNSFEAPHYRLRRNVWGNVPRSVETATPGLSPCRSNHPWFISSTYCTWSDFDGIGVLSSGFMS